MMADETQDTIAQPQEQINLQEEQKLKRRRRQRQRQRNQQQSQNESQQRQQNQIQQENGGNENPVPMSPPHTQVIFDSEQSDDEQFTANINDTPRTRSQQYGPVSRLNTCEDLGYATLATNGFVQQTQPQNSQQNNSSSLFDNRSPRTQQLIQMYKPKYLCGDILTRYPYITMVLDKKTVLNQHPN